MFNFTPLLGAQSRCSASQSLLELDGDIKVLVDVGWDDDFDVRKLDELERLVPTISIILLTHATSAHLGAFAHCCKHFPQFAQIPIYATNPVIALGRTLLQNVYSSAPLAATLIPSNSLSEASIPYSSPTDATDLNILLPAPTTEEIASYFSLIHPLKYSQPHQPLPSPNSPPLNGLTITAYNAGHTLGGTIWHIQHGLESIVYAVDWNQVRENILPGAAWLGGSGASGTEIIEQLRKPTAMVCSTKGAERISPAGGRKKRDDLLLDMISAVVAKGGTVLIPTDTSARVLELAYMLEHAWRAAVLDNASDSPLRRTRLYLASKNVGATMRYARSMLEWMDDKVIREFEAESSNNANQPHRRTDSRRLGDYGPDIKGGGPFDFKYLKLLERKSQIDKILSAKDGQVILASNKTLEWGFSRDALRTLAADTKNLIILTEDHGPSRQDAGDRLGLDQTLWQWYLERLDGVAIEKGRDGDNLEQVYTGGRDFQFRDVQRTPLMGKEVMVYQQYLATRRQLQSTAETRGAVGLDSSADIIDDASSTTSSSSDESDPERQGKALNISATLGHSNRNKSGIAKEEVGSNILLRQPGVYDYDVRGKKGREKLYPFVTRKRRLDDFGEIIRPEDYLRAEERDDATGHDLRDAGLGKQRKLGQKRKWGDSGLQDSPILPADNAKRHRQADVASRGTLRNGQNGLSEPHAFNGSEIDDLSDESEAETEEQVIGPSKIKIDTSSVRFYLKIAYIDFAGLHDQRSLSMLIPLIQPRKLILIGGTVSETNSIAEDCRKKLISPHTSAADVEGDHVQTPSINQTVFASVDTNAWSIKLSEALVRRLHWQNVRGLGVVTLTGLSSAPLSEIQLLTENLNKKKRKTQEGEAEPASIESIADASEHIPDSVPMLDALPVSMAAATRSAAQPLHVGDLRLADLRKFLQSAGYTAEFRGEGTLVVDAIVAVRKSGTGKIEVEGGGLTMPTYQPRNSEGTFHMTKRMIYESLAVIAGG